MLYNYDVTIKKLQITFIHFKKITLLTKAYHNVDVFYYK